jgi:outer membrane protein assembly factor BamB
MKKAAVSFVALLLMSVTIAVVVAAQQRVADPAAASDWPQWRGPDGTGVARDATLPSTWNGSENIAWKAELRGLGVSSPIVVADRVFVTYQVGNGARQRGTHPTLARGPLADEGVEQPLGGSRAADAEDTTVTFAVAAFARTDGSLLWEYEFAAQGPQHPVHDKHNLASPSPVSDGERVYAWFGTGQVVALDMNGVPLWQRHLGEEYSPFELQWGHASSPTLYGDSLILQCDHPRESYLLWLDKRTGAEQRKLDRGNGMHSHSTPVVVPGPRGDELIVNSSERLESFDPLTGELLWHAGEPNRFPIAVPTYADGILYTSRGYRAGPYMAIRLGGQGDVTNTRVLWRVPTGAPYIASILYFDGLIYMANGNGIASVVDPATGERLWQERIGGVYSATPVAGDGKVYLFSETGEAVVLQAGRVPRVIARNPLNERVIASPAIAGGRIFVRTDRHLIAIGN